LLSVSAALHSVREIQSVLVAGRREGFLAGGVGGGG
jgi:hypothetical protein